MARHRKDPGARRQVRVDLHKPGFLIPAPDAPWIECMIVEVSDEWVCLEVGALAVPELFGLAFTADGESAPGVFAGLAAGRNDRRPFRHRERASAGV